MHYSAWIELKIFRCFQISVLDLNSHQGQSLKLWFCLPVLAKKSLINFLWYQRKTFWNLHFY
jgi:hypothetical protein